MSEPSSGLYDRANEAAEAIRARVPEAPRVGVVLGSGLGDFVEALRDATSLPYGEIPHLPRPTVIGHQGNLVVGRLETVPVMAFQGRFHFYEGHDLAAVTFPIRILQALGVRTVILTAAVGGIRSDLKAGDLVLVRDHLNLLGGNPLRGPHDERLGVRFLDLTEVYASRLRAIAHEEARRLGISLSEGIYASVPGPCYETPAEVRMLATLGADVVGMSTVPEAIVARHAGIEVLAVAVVANLAAGLSPTPLSHEEVMEAGHQAAPRFRALLDAVIRRLGD